MAVDRVPGLDLEANDAGSISRASAPLEASHNYTSGLRVCFKDVSYDVKNRANRKENLRLLTDVTAVLNPGEMTALLGPSGSGKSTLLDVLAGRKTQGSIHGMIQYGGENVSKDFLRHHTGYVEQYDTLIDNFTVRDMLLYTAELKLNHKEYSEEQKEKIVDDVISALSLTKCQNVVIGNQLNRGISGGQAKRTNIGLALVSQPRVLFLDEPTSGLDSCTANQVIKLVKGLTQSGITICATIHSPSQFAFSMFDQAMILLSGQVAYIGAVGDDLERYFRLALPDAPARNENESLAEWVTEITTSADNQQQASHLSETWKSSPGFKLQEKKLGAYLERTQSGLDFSAQRELSTTRATVTPFYWGLKTFFQYRSMRNLRDLQFLGPRIADKILTTTLIASLYYGQGSLDTAASSLNTVQLLYMWIALPSFGAATYVPTLMLERPLLIRERNDGLYRPITYLCGKLLEEFIVVTIVSLFFACIVFFPVQLQGSFLIFWLGYLTTLCIGITIAYTIAGLCPSVESASSAVPAYVVTLLFMSGFLIRWDDIPSYWQWYSYIDFIHFAWAAQMQNQFGAKDTQLTREATVLEIYDLTGSSAWEYLFYEFCFLIFFTFTSWLVLAFKRHGKR